MVAIGNGTLALPRLALHRETVRHLVGSPSSEDLREAAGHTRNQTCTCQPFTWMPCRSRAVTCDYCPSAVCT
jgi:hypothetical protein